MLRAGHAVALCTLALLTVGVIMVASAGMSLKQREAVTFASIIFSRNSLNMALAVAAMGACAMLPIRRLVPVSVRGGGENGLPSPLAAPILERSEHRFLSPGWI